VRETPAAAAERAARSGATRLVVTAGGEVVGLVDARSLRRGWAADVARLARWPIPVVPRTMPLAAVAQVFRDTGLDFLVVIDREEMAGTISRPDLVELGVPNL
jgi:CBS domain containing-hemolysin-like protein